MTRTALAVASWTICCAGFGILAVLAFQHGVMMTSALMVAGGLGAFAIVVAQVERLATRGRQIEYRPLTQADRITARQRILLDHAPVPLLFETSDDVLRVANLAARRLFGVEDRLVETPPDLRAAIAQVARGERGLVTLVPAGRRDSLIIARRFAVTAADATGAGGVTRLVALTDIDAELHLAEAGVLRELMDVLSHEIMNSLTPIVSLVETAVELNESAETHAGPEITGERACDPLGEALSTALRRARGLERFVQGYRQLARVPSSDVARVDLGTLLREAARVFESRWGKRVAIELVMPRMPVMAMLDAELIDQALLHLLNNAAEAALEGAWPRVSLRGAADRNGLVIDVLDNGPGVGEEQREAIFRPFVSFKSGGSGIGLSIARQIALGHGGDVRLAPAPEEWTTCFRLSA